MTASDDRQANRLGMPLGVFVAVRALPVGLILLCLAGAGLFYHFSQVTENYRLEHHAFTSEHINTTLASALEGTVNQLRDIAENEIFRNAIVDLERRNDYVPLFLKSLTLAGFSDVPMALTDYKGRLLFANDVEGAGALVQQSGWQEITLEKSKEYVSWSVDGLLVAEPVIVYGLSEAALVGRLQPEHLENLFKLLSVQDEFILTDESNTIVYSSVPNDFNINASLDDLDLSGWYVHAGKSNERLNIRVYTVENLGERNAFESQLVMMLGLAIFGLLVTAAGIIVATGRGVTGSVQRLSDTFSSILASSTAELSIRAQVRKNAPRELNDLALHFNELIEKVDDSTTSKDEVSAILRCLTEILVVTTPDGTVTWSNKTYENFLDMIGREATGSFYEKELWLGRADDEDHVTIEVPYPTDHPESQERVIIVYWSRAILFDEQGNQQGYIYTGQDITQMRKVEHDLKQKQKTLEKARADAELANQAKSSFLASMSHEIRTPMNGVLGMTRLILNSSLTNKQRTQAQLVESSALSLLTLINDILDFSKIEADKLDVEYEAFDLTKTLSDCAQTLTLAAHQKGIELILDISGVDQKVLNGDSIRLKQIVTNLCSNAIKFTEEGYVLIRATLTPAFDDKRVLTINVQDTGIGIKEENIKSLFKAFQQEDASTTRRFGGTGLGLAIVKRLCRLMGGDVTARSTLGEGSTFTASIELGSDLPYQPAMPDQILMGKTALVVDNVMPSLQAVSDAMRVLGAEVSSVSTLDQAETLCEDTNIPPYDFVLIDDNLPEEKTAVLMSDLRKKGALGSPIVLLLGDIIKDFNEDCLSERGLDGYCIKPVSPALLSTALRPLLKSASAAEAESAGVTAEADSAKLSDLPVLNEANDPPVVTESGDEVELQSESEHSADDHTYSDAVPTLSPTENPAFALTQNAKEAATPLVPLEELRILLVDDNEINQMVAQGILEELNLTAKTAMDGAEAIARLKGAAEMGSPYHLVLMDCQMPVMDGFSATEKIRAGEAGAEVVDVTIIAMTANAMQGDRDRCLAAGMTDYVAKPVEPEALVAVLNHQFGYGLSI